MKFLTKVLLLLSICSANIGAEIIPGQAVSWTDFSHISGIAIGQEFAYFGTTEGVLRYHRYENRWYDPITASDGLPNSVVRRLAVSFDDERLTVETDVGIYTYERVIGNWFLSTDFPQQDYRSSAPEAPLPLLFMPIGYQMIPKGFIEDSYFRRYEITAWRDDNFNTIFGGTWGMGPIKIDSRDYTAQLMPYGLLQKQTDAIYIEGDSIWLAGNGGDRPPEYADSRLGVTLFNRRTGEFTYFEPRQLPGFDSEIIYDIAGDEKNLYFAGRQGLTVRQRSEDYFYTVTRRDGLPDNETTALAIGLDSVWIGTAHGLALYTPSTDTMVVVGGKILRDRFITDLAIVGNRIIIGTDKGTYYINVVSNKIGRLKDPANNLSGLIRHIFTGGGDLFIASDWGLTRINLESEHAETVPFTDIPGGVYAVAANDKYIAAAIQDGLMLINRTTGLKRVFNKLDGLLSIEINAMVPEGDYLWLGSDQGLTRFKWVNPDRVD